MAVIHDHPQVKLVCAVMRSPDGDARSVISALEKEWGPVDLASEEFDFNHTDYYVDEFGSGLLKQYLSFDRLMDAADLPARKQWSNVLEAQWTTDGRRCVNIDPGYLADAKLVFATAKNLAHRLFIGANIFADLQLMYRHHTFEVTPWTFADVRMPEHIAFFNRVRARYMSQLKEEHAPL